MKAVATERRRIRYRRLHVMLERQGNVMNLKKLGWLCCEEQPSMPPGRPEAGLGDAQTDGRRFRTLAVVDDYSRECLGLFGDASLSALLVVREHDALMLRRGRPAMMVSDSGTELALMVVRS